MKKIIGVASLVFIFFSPVFGQSANQQVFLVDSFINLIRINHPIAKQANIQIDLGNARLMMARGNFDPFFGMDASNKTFDGKNYYYYNNPELMVPLPIGNIRTGLENNGGDNLSPETTMGKSSYLGVELPLAKGLVLDKRRAVLQQAKLFSKQSAEERLVIINNLLFDSYMAYWNWAGAYQLYETYSKFVDIAEKRLRLVRIAFMNGDRSLMDTTEAYTQFQNYQLLQSESFLKWKNDALELSNYLWQQNDTPFILQENHIPEKLSASIDTDFKDPDYLIQQSTVHNPLFKVYDYKLNSLEVERKLKYQDMLPYFSVKANLLNKDYNVFKNVNNGFLQNNNKWGIEFKMPLFLREARGSYKLVQLKAKETTLELQFKRQQIENKIRTYFNQYNALKQQLATIQLMYSNYQQLLRNEELKYAQGESSLFLVNSRETKLVELMQKQIELSVKLYKAKYSMEWAAGLLK
ncbi:TolC family protein [Flavihumibacter profundi]|uniref:TolC family protein n=1 Tax=Flavihumibacter profundi TaxID=2716883 RepID=UPI001CC68D0C|nr:TolC family protein [Flavihumibacter profundi]MBZ5855474.1 TolC family protein [Flavihumibacter profundi]